MSWSRVFGGLMVLLSCACGGEDGSGSTAGTGGVGATSAGGMNAGGVSLGGSGGGSAGGVSTGGSANVGGSNGAIVITDPGTVTDDWAAYCVATFTLDYEVVDSFDTPLFTAHAGEQYLMMSYPDTFGGPNSAEMVYLTAQGPLDFQVDPGDGPAPFTTDCPKDISVLYYAVFKDLSVYSDESLTTKLCDLTAGTALPLSGGYGFGLRTSSQGQAIYDIVLSPFSAQCGGAERGFVLVVMVALLGQNTFLVPIRAIIGPP